MANGFSHPAFGDIQAYIENGSDAGNAVAIGEHIGGCTTCGTLAMTFRGGAWNNVVDPALYPDKKDFRSGGMGNTFTALDVRIGRQVIIKEPAEPGGAAYAGASLRMESRLMRERRILGLLEHPAIVPVYETGQWPDGTPFFVMRRIHGPTLVEKIADSRRFSQRILLLPQFISITDAIAHAHERGVVHRDLTPDNMMLGEFDEPYVIDWGIATVVENASESLLDVVEPVGDGMTRGGIGKDPYAPPEQRDGMVPEPRFDVYSLGVTLHHLLIGRRPKRGRDGVFEPLPRECPVELASIVARATDVDPSRRFTNAGELAAQLRSYQEGKLVEAHRYTLAARAARWLRRHRVAVVIVIGCLLAGAAIGTALRARQVSLAATERATAASFAAEEARSERTAADERATNANNDRDDAMKKWEDATAHSRALGDELKLQRRLTKREMARLEAAIEAERAAATEAMDLRVLAETARIDSETAAFRARQAQERAQDEARDERAARQAAEARTEDAETQRHDAEARARTAAVRAQVAEDRAVGAETRAATAEAGAIAAADTARAAEKRAGAAEKALAEAERAATKVEAATGKDLSREPLAGGEQSATIEKVGP